MINRNKNSLPLLDKTDGSNQDPSPQCKKLKITSKFNQIKIRFPVSKFDVFYFCLVIIISIISKIVRKDLGVYSLIFLGIIFLLVTFNIIFKCNKKVIINMDYNRATYYNFIKKTFYLDAIASLYSITHHISDNSYRHYLMISLNDREEIKIRTNSHEQAEELKYKLIEYKKLTTKEL